MKKFIRAFKEHFRARFGEWVVGLGLFTWGLLVLAAPSSYFASAPMLSAMTNLLNQDQWGWLAVFIGGLRLTFLFINGSWRKSAHLRAIGSGLSACVWAAMAGSYLTLVGYVVANIALVITLLSADLYSLWFAAEDAGNSDKRVK